ncbi:hypothetical protein WJX73_004453 [Symbiochloris irregularis]|uniref:Rubisco LSMT substrate-binding domain-containing protein n=1 Tax=Symbiochloris irregularis TaxID=706552 RepID=A0AAW1NLU0_9CHLO
MNQRLSAPGPSLWPATSRPEAAHLRTRRVRSRTFKRRLCSATAVVASAEPVPTSCDTHTSQLMSWLEAQGAPEQAVKIGHARPPGEDGYSVTVASRKVEAGETIMRIPERLVITLDRIFKDEAMGELLTTGKLSELACLTLYLMYEKKRGRASPWVPLIKELDRTRGRGQQGARTPLLWAPGQAERLLAGSPVLKELKLRLQGIEKEYHELDTVWFMAGSLFNQYPYDIPTEAFGMGLFLQAFAAVQASIVHLQGVAPGKRFALIPLGPPLLSYSPLSKAMLRYNAETHEVQLAADQAYSECAPVRVWCGPQPNGRLLINYGIVDEDNPYDRLSLTVTLPLADPLYSLKRSLLMPHGLSTQQTFQMQRGQALPDNLLQYVRFAHTDSEASARAAASGFSSPSPSPVEPALEHVAILHLVTYLQQRLDRYPTTIEQDTAVLEDPMSNPRERVAARLVRIEKRILQGALKQVMALPGAGAMPENVAPVQQVIAVRLS